MDDIPSQVIECPAGQVAGELARLGIDPSRLVRVSIEPEDWLTQGHRDFRRRVLEAVLPDDAIDPLIKQARREANEDMVREATPGPG